jgi:DNA-binding MarR family transcriptional regulator
MSRSPEHPESIEALAAELRALVGRLKRKLREQGGGGDFTPSQVSVLLRLEKDGPATASQLARAEGMRPQSMGAVIAPLEAAGLITGTADPADGRQTILALTEKFRAWLQESRAARQDYLARMIESRLSAAEQAQLAACVPLLRRLAGE